MTHVGLSYRTCCIFVTIVQQYMNECGALVHNGATQNTGLVWQFQASDILMKWPQEKVRCLSSKCSQPKEICILWQRADFAWESNGKKAGNETDQTDPVACFFVCKKDQTLKCACAEKLIKLKSPNLATIVRVPRDLQKSKEVKEKILRGGLILPQSQWSCSPHFPGITKTILFLWRRTQMRSSESELD